LSRELVAVGSQSEMPHSLAGGTRDEPTGIGKAVSKYLHCWWECHAYHPC